MAKTKQKKVIVEHGEHYGIQWTAEIVPGESIRITGTKRKARYQASGYRIVRVVPNYHSLGPISDFRLDAVNKLSKASLETQRRLAELVEEWQARRLELVYVQDAFLHDADIDLLAFDNVALAISQFHTVPEMETVDAEFDLTFQIGEQCVTGSYNLIYTDEILGITAKTVTTEGKYGGTNSPKQRFSLAKFVRNNWDYNAGKIRRHNDVEYMAL